MIWAQLLAYITGTVDQELLLRNEYLAAENRILKAQIKGRLLLSQEVKTTLAEIAHRLGPKALGEVASTAQPDTILGWYRKLIANKFDGSRFRRRVGRPKVDEEVERLVLRMAKENPSWGYDRIVGALANRPSAVGSDGGQPSSSPWPFSCSEAQARRFMERLYPLTPGRFGGNGLLHGGSPDAQRVADLLCAVLHSFGDSPSEPGRIHAVSGSGLDGAAASKHDYGAVGMPERLPLSVA